MAWSVAELVAWSKSAAGRLEVEKLCKSLGTIKKNIQFLGRSAVLWGYNFHYTLMIESPKEVKKLVRGLVKDNFFIFGIINASCRFPFLVRDRLRWFL
jgi:hypothetical protein